MHSPGKSYTKKEEKKMGKKHMKKPMKDKTRAQAEHMSSVYARGSLQSKRA